MVKTYVITTGSIFGLIVLAHVARVVAEGPHVFKEPIFDALTVLAAALTVWSYRLAR